VIFYIGVIVGGIWNGSGYLAVSRYMNFLFFLPLVLVAVRTHEDLRKVFTTMVLSWVIAFPYGLRQMMRFDARFGVGIHESNYLAANLCLVIPLALVLATQHRDRLRRALWYGAALTLIVMLVLTGSRGGFLGLVVAGTVFVYRRRGTLAALAVVGALVLAALPTTLGERALQTLSENAEVSTGLEASNQAHTALFWAALRMIADAPIVGVGPYNFKEMSVNYSGLDQGLIAHNTYLELAAEVGLPVLGLFLLVVVATYRGLSTAAALRGLPGRARELATWADALRCGLIGFLVAGIFISAQYEKWFWLVVFLSITVERMARRESTQALIEEETAARAPAAWRATPQTS
jgi:putative inorganic carbon (HCO3(-)) transporter